MGDHEDFAVVTIVAKDDGDPPMDLLDANGSGERRRGLLEQRR
jgi:hypothetical protein